MAKLSIAGVLVVGALAMAAGTASATGAAPVGFAEGSDSWPMPVGGTGPYLEPSIGGSYGGYVGMIGSWSWWLGCKQSFLAWSQTNSQQANANLIRYRVGIGTAVYWFMGGPGVDPNYSGSSQEAYAWGKRQAERTVSDLAKRPVPYRVVFMDIELPLVKPAPDNGWNSVYTSPCSGRVRVKHIPAAVDRADVNGFYDYIAAHSDRVPGVYSSPNVWGAIFGAGSASRIPHTREWTYEPETANLGLAPSGWCLKGSASCAQFFGGVASASPMALMWQWSGGGGVRNGIGDFDQIDTRNVQ